MSALLGGDRREPLMAASRRGLPLDHDPEGAADEEGSFDRPEPSARRGRALLLTAVTGLGLAAALGAGALVFVGEGDASAVAGEAPAAIVVASAETGPDLSPLRAAMLARAEGPAPAAEEQAAPAPERREVPAAPIAPAKEAAAPAVVPTPEPVVASVPVLPAPEPRSAPSPAAPASPPPPALSAAEVSALLKRAKALVEIGDVAAARRFLERAAAAGDGAALFALAETHDPAVLDRWRVHGVKADAAKARELYRQAAERGASGSAARLAAMR